MSCNCCDNKNCIHNHTEEEHGHHGHNHHDHEHLHFEGGANKKQLVKICIATGLFIVVFVLDKIFDLASINPGPANWVLPFVCYFIAYLILGKDILKEAFEGIIHGELLDENFLMSIASLGAFALGIYKGCIGEVPDGFEEGCAVVLFYSIGEYFQQWALGRSRKSIADLMDLRPDVAHILKDGNIVDIDPDEVEIGSQIIINMGEKIPLDGTLVSENAVLDTMAISGESEYENILKGADIFSGSINMSEGSITITTTKVYDDSTVAKILDLVENAADKKAKTETFIARFARIYTPIVVGLAVAIAIIPPIIGLIINTWASAGLFSDLTWTTWVYRALSFLVVSCPCALVISIPLSFFMGIGTASRYNILVKGSNCLELISKADIYVSDKTGTLTVGKEIKPEAKNVIKWLKKMGSKIYVLSGDKEDVVKEVASNLGIKNYSYELKPQEKVSKLEDIMKNKNKSDVVAFVGDGINDAPSLMRADVGISMGGIGSDAAVEVSNIVLMKDNLNGIPLIKKIARRTMRIVWENIVFSIGIKVVVLVLSAFGITNMWFAVFADVGVALLAVLNALRVGAVKYDKDNITNK